MAINFPDNPNPNDVFTVAGKSWIWDGTTWKIYSSTSSGIALGDLSVNTNSVGTAALSYNSTTGVFTYTPPDLSGYLTQQYTLPTASTTVLGGVKVDGSTITINGSGVISGANTYSLPTATTTVLGGVKIDGTTITINNGVISSADPVPTTITVANESTDTTCFPLFTTNPTGNLAPKTSTGLKLNSSSGQLEAGSFKKTGGTAAEFLKADGSIDSSTYSTVLNLNDLSDVNATGAVNGKIIKHNGTSWVLADDQSSGSGGGSSDPVGTIVMWSGASNNLPTGYQLCDGTTPVTTELQLVVGVGNTVPDLRDRFVVGAASNYSVGDKGGSTSETVNISGSDTVNISGSDTVTISGTTGAPVSSNLFGLGDVGGSNKHVHSFSGSATVNISASDTVNISGSDTVNTVPPYYALCYIIKHTSATSLSNTFTGLSDTPSSHSNGKILQSNGSALIWVDPPSSSTTILNNADNRIITGSSAATGQLYAESSLTYDGNILSFGDDKKIRYGSNFRMEMYADSSGGYIKMPIDGSGAFPLEIHSGGSEVIKIDDGNTQILTGIKDKDGDLGSSGQILSSTGTQVNWIDAPTVFSGNYSDLYNKPTLFSGSYNDLSSKPTLVTSINGLSDVSTGTISTNDVLQWNGSAWAAAALATGSDLVAQVRRAIDTSTSTQYNPVGYVDKLTLTLTNVDVNSKILLFFRMSLGHAGSGDTKGRVIGPGTLYGGSTEFTTGSGLGNISSGPPHGILWDTSNSTTREFKIQYADNGGVYSTISNCELVAIELKIS